MGKKIPTLQIIYNTHFFLQKIDLSKQNNFYSIYTKEFLFYNMIKYDKRKAVNFNID